jgi:hypothetical protein
MIKVKLLFPQKGRPAFLVEGQPVNERDLAEVLDRSVRTTGKTDVFLYGPGTMEETVSAVEMAAKRTAVRKLHLVSLLPFGPSLAIASVLTMLAWHWIGPQVQVLFFFGSLMAILAGGCAVLMLVASYLIRLAKTS